MIDFNNPFHILLLAYGIQCILFVWKNDKPRYGLPGIHYLWHIAKIGCIFMAIGVVMEILRMFS